MKLVAGADRATVTLSAELENLADFSLKLSGLQVWSQAAEVTCEGCVCAPKVKEHLGLTCRLVPGILAFIM